MSVITGHATSEGTAGYFNSRKELGGWLAGAGLHCSRVGFGGYRVDDHTPLHSEALKTALLSGCNLIDTSTNYTDGGSERLVGKALSELIQVGVLDRDQVVVVSKVGYVQGEALQMAMEKEAAHTPIPEMVKYQDGCWHCLHPDFLAIQLEKSLARLQLDCIDFYLLHNPEYFLMDAAARGSRFLLPKLREEFYARIQKAFEYLEEQVDRGRIQGYGVSSNTFGAPASRADATSVSRMWDVARSIGKGRNGNADKHHFRVIQLPFNLFESGPLLEKNTGDSDSMTALEFANKHDLSVLVNRPLNAFTQQSMVRLTDFSVNASVGAISTLLQQLEELEKEFVQKIAPTLNINSGSFKAEELFNWSTDLNQVQSLPISADRWSQIEEQIQHQVTAVSDQISSQIKEGPWVEWQGRYLPKLRSLLASIRNEANQRSQATSDKIRGKLDPLLPEAWKDQSLSKKAIGILIHTQGVSCVLNGMRRASYVQDSMGTVTLPRLGEKETRTIFEAFR